MAALSRGWLGLEMWTERECFSHFSNEFFAGSCLNSANKEIVFPLDHPTLSILNILPSDKYTFLVKPYLMVEIYYFIITSFYNQVL